MTAPPRTGTHLARFSVLAFAGYAAPLVVALVAIPYAAQALGPMRFGLLGIAWALVEYLSFVDLGLGRATVRFVANSLARNGEDLRQTVATSIAAQAAVGFVATVLLALFAPLLAHGVFALEPAVRAEATGMFRAVAANLGIVVLISALRGVLEGAHRFDLSNAIKIPTASATIIIPAVGAVMGLSLGTIFWAVFFVRALAVVVTIVLLPRAVRGFAWEYPREWARLRPLFSFSSWLMVSSVINPILAGFDRLVLATLAGAAAVGLYTGPYEGATRLLLVPISMVAVLFPALSSQVAGAETMRTQRVIESALRQLALIMALPILVLFAFAPELLALWLGEEFARAGATPLRILLVGVAANALAHVPFVFLYAIGRPDLPAKNHVLELALHLPITIVLVRAFGVTGAALAWTFRITLDAALLAIQAARHDAFRGISEARTLWAASMTLIGALGAGVLLAAAGNYRAVPVIILVGVATLGYAALAWRNAISSEERSSWAGLLPGAKRPAARA